MGRLGRLRLDGRRGGHLLLERLLCLGGGLADGGVPVLGGGSGEAGQDVEPGCLVIRRGIEQGGDGGLAECGVGVGEEGVEKGERGSADLADLPPVLGGGGPPLQDGERLHGLGADLGVLGRGGHVENLVDDLTGSRARKPQP